MWLKIEAISNFENPDNVRTLTPQLYNFLETELKMEKVSFDYDLLGKPIIWLAGHNTEKDNKRLI